MEQRMVSQESNRFIYNIKDNGLGFYLIIPKSTKVNITLDLIDNLNDNVVKNIPFDNGKVYAIPEVDMSVFEKLKANDADSFVALDDAYAKIINKTYQILTYNHIEVDRNIYFVEEANYGVFQGWFIKKYGGRVNLIKKEVSFPKAVSPINTLNTSFSLGDTAALSAVDIQKSDMALSSVSSDDTFNNDEIKNLEGKDFGFVSYVLLGVVVAVVSLVLLYFLV